MRRTPRIIKQSKQDQYSEDIKRIYKDLLGREPDPKGHSYWLKQMLSGKSTPDVLEKTIKNTDEHKEHFKIQNEIREIYKSKSRDLDQSGLDYWTEKIKSGKNTINTLSRTIDLEIRKEKLQGKKIATQKLSERNQTKLKDLAEANKKKTADLKAKADAHAKAAKKKADDLKAKADAKVKSNEKTVTGFKSKTTAKVTANESKIAKAEAETETKKKKIEDKAAKLKKIQNDIKEVYKTKLDRDVAESGLNYWAGKISSGENTIADLERSIKNTDEYKKKEIKDQVNEVYKTRLDRDADESGLDYWVNKISSGENTIADLERTIVSSDDYREAAADEVKPWQTGYDSLTSNFVDNPTTKQREAIENQMTGILEQKGLLAGPDTERFIMDAWDHAGDLTQEGSTLAALKYIANLDAEDTAEARNDVWGASGADKGKSFLKGQEGITNTSGIRNRDLIEQLYEDGFGREPDEKGLNYWMDRLEDGMSYSRIASSFGVSLEASIRDLYHEHYGRDADDSGLQYWLSKGDLSSVEGTILDPNTLETYLRGNYGTHLGQFSNEADRQANIAAGGIWTDVHEGGYADYDWTGYKRGVASTHGEKEPQDLTGLAKFQDEIITGEKTKEEVADDIETRGEIMTIHALQNKDDAEGGSGISQTATLEEIDPHMKSGSGELLDLANKLGEEQWLPITSEITKEPGPELTIEELAERGLGVADYKPWLEVQHKDEVMYDPGFEKDERGTNRNTLSHDYQVPLPPDYKGPNKANVNRQDVDYMTKLDGTVPNRSLRPLDSSYTAAPQQAVRNQGAFVAGTSAKGVRRRQSSAARSGRAALGTKQLARNNMQIKSLNI